MGTQKGGVTGTLNQLMTTLHFENAAGKQANIECLLDDSAEKVFYDAKNRLASKNDDALFTKDGSDKPVDYRDKTIGDLIQDYGDRFAVMNSGVVQ